MLGFLSDAKAINEAITGFLTSTPNPTYNDVEAFLGLYSGADRELAAQLLVQRGVPADIVASAKTTSGFGFSISPTWAALATVSSAVSAYHGYKRNQSVGWAIGWGFFGLVAPILTPVIALAQGFGKRKAA